MIANDIKHILYAYLACNIRVKNKSDPMTLPANYIWSS